MNLLDHLGTLPNSSFIITDINSVRNHCLIILTLLKKMTN